LPQASQNGGRFEVANKTLVDISEEVHRRQQFLRSAIDGDPDLSMKLSRTFVPAVPMHQLFLVHRVFTAIREMLNIEHVTGHVSEGAFEPNESITVGHCEGAKIEEPAIGLVWTENVSGRAGYSCDTPDFDWPN